MNLPTKPKHLLACCILLAICSQLKSQTVPFVKYTSKNGLMSDRITTITQDEQGFMWFGSFFGLCRYDGISFEKMKLHPRQQNKFVTCLLPSQNKVYAGFLFQGGLAEYDHGKLNAYFIKGKDSASANEFLSMVDDRDGSILLCNSSYQLYRFRKGAFQLIYTLHVPNPTNQVRSMQKDRYANLWIATERGLYILPPPYNHSIPLFNDFGFFTLVKDQADNIIFSRTNGISTTTETCEGFKDGKIINSRIITISQAILPTKFGGNVERGVWGIDPYKGLKNLQTGNIYKIPFDVSTDINMIYADRENNIWIANEPGVFKVSNFTIRTYPFDEISAAGGAIAIENDSSVWVTNSKALFHISNSSMQKKKYLGKQHDYFGTMTIDQKKNVWIGFWNKGLSVAGNQQGKMINKKDFANFDKRIIKAQSIIEDRSGIIWVAGANGIFRIKNQKIIESFQPVNAAGVPSFITCMALDEDRKTIWLGDNALGIIRVSYSPLPGDLNDYMVTGYITAKEGLKDGYMRSLFLDYKKNLWAGTRAGGIFMIREMEHGFMVKECNTEASLSCTRVTDIVAEDSLAVWFATCEGIYRMDQQSGKWSHFNTSDGLMNAEVFTIRYDKKHQILWALTAQGITRFNLKDQDESPKPITNITSVLVLGKQDSSALQSQFPVEYSYTRNSIGFNFAGASFIDEKKIRYKYMLQGYDKDWSEPVTTNNVNYASLPPGKYTFKVMASNAKEQWSENPAQFEFVIVRPFYKSPLFIFILVTLLIFIIYIIRIQRLQQNYRIEKIRLNIARDLHDDIGSTLGSINLLSKTATRKMDISANQEEIGPIFQKIGESAENTLEAMDDIVWSINPKKDKVYDLVIRMREFAIPLFEAKSIDFNFEIDGDRDLAFPMNLRRNVFLIYKEAIHNILKHAQAKKAVIRLHISHNQFRMQVKDDGKGFNITTSTRRNGLKNMQSRAEMVEGKLMVDTSAEGTEIIFTAPLR